MTDALAAYLAPSHVSWLTSDEGAQWRELECSLLFADVSGFTSLGERLARRGRIGAEQLTEAVNAIFTAMLDEVDRGGGELLKFGGDAILVLFAGDDHARRAASTAKGIQSALRQLRVLPGRSPRLSVSAGVASGSGHLFLAGTAPRELIVAGPLATEVVAAEGEADAGEVVVSARTANSLEPAARQARRGGRILLGELVPGAPIPPAEPTVTGADPMRGLPDHLHEHVPGYGEHRTIAVGFVQFRGTDELLKEGGPPALAAALHELLVQVADTCRAFGVTLVSSDVDQGAGKLVLCTGAPTASPDDVDRLLGCLRSIVGAEVPLTLRAGANRGPAFTVDLGPDRRRVWSVMGDAVNLAARIMGRAADGQVLASQVMLDRARDSFATSPVEPFAVKGKSEPVSAAVVGEPRSHAAAGLPEDTLFVGRERELQALGDAVGEAVAGRRRIVEIVGEPGIGKSALVSRLLTAVQGVSVVRIQAGPYGAQTPYLAVRGPFRQMVGCDPDASDEAVERTLSRVVCERAPELEAWLPLLGVPLGLDLADTPETAALAQEFARERLKAIFAHLLDLLVPVAPILAVIEDAHWLDEPSSDLLRHLITADRATGPRRGWGAATDRVASSPPAGLAAVVTRRDVPEGMSLEGESELVRLSLEPLPDTDAARLVPGAADEALPLALTRQLLERAEGNPLLLGELVAAVRAGRSLDELPDTAEALMTARIDTLPRAERLLVREASVLGVRVSPDLLAEVVGVERSRLQSDLEGLSDFLLPEGVDAYRFRHELLRRAAYGALSFRRRRELHARAGEVIRERAGEDAGSHSELLAIHFHAAGRWAESWRYSRVAGERASRRSAPVEAAGFYAGALEAARHLRDLDPAAVGWVAERLGDAAELSGDYERAASAFRRARRLAPNDRLRQAALCLRHGQVAESSRHLSAALRWFTRGLRALDRAPAGQARDSLRARLTLAHGATRLRAGRLRECLPYLEQAVDLATASEDAATEAHGYYLLDWAHTDLGHPEAKRYRDLALPIFERLGDHARQGRVLNNLGVNAYYECDWERAVEFYERSVAASESAGDLVEGRATALNNIAEIRIDQGRVDEAEELLGEALATWRGARYRAGVGTALKNLGRIAARRGNTERAAELIAQARAEFEAIGSASLVGEADLWEAERLVLAGDASAALEVLASLEAAGDRVDMTPAIQAASGRLRAKALLAMGEFEQAAIELRQSAAAAREAGADFDEALSTLELVRLTHESPPGRKVADGVGPAAETRARETLRRLGVRALPAALR